MIGSHRVRVHVDLADDLIDVANRLTAEPVDSRNTTPSAPSQTGLVLTVLPVIRRRRLPSG
jgi:hypothetical protein